jgi:SAM-dependent methyltransferase
MRRNSGSLSAAPPDDPILAALSTLTLNEQGTMLDVGGASGRIAAGFLRDHPRWFVRVVEPSAEAIAAGRNLFPGVSFDQGSIANPLPAPPDGSHYDVVVISGVLCWVERALLSRAIANTDTALSDGGLLVIADFDPPAPRANPYHHAPGVFTYKQDYAQSYLSLGIYHLEFRRSVAYGSASNPSDPYDRHWMTGVLRKDLHGRYAR